MLVGTVDLGAVWCHPDNNVDSIAKLLTDQRGKVVLDVAPRWMPLPPHADGARLDFPFYRLRSPGADAALLPWSHITPHHPTMLHRFCHFVWPCSPVASDAPSWTMGYMIPFREISCVYPHRDDSQSEE